MESQHTMRFSEILQYSEMFYFILDGVTKYGIPDCDKLLDVLINIISPILVESLQSHSNILNNIKTAFKKFIFSCFMGFYQDNDFEFDDHFKSTIKPLEKMYIDLISHKNKDQNKWKSRSLKKYIKPKNYNNLFHDIPKDILSHSMSYIDASNLIKLEIVSHKFLQCARAPIAISILTQKFFDVIYYYINRQSTQRYVQQIMYNKLMKRYQILKDVDIKRNVLRCLIKRYNDIEEFNLYDHLSWIDLHELTIQKLYEMKYFSLNRFILSALNMNIIRGLKYIPSPESQLMIEINHKYCYHHSLLFNDYLTWKYLNEIRSQFQRFNDIYISLNMGDSDAFTRFLLFSACCHSNIERLRIKYHSWSPDGGTNTDLFMENYKNIIADLNELKYLSINSRLDDGHSAEFIEDGKCFMNALMNKIKKNTLETLEFEGVLWID